MTTLRVGDVVDVEDRDYKYGTGRLIMRVTQIGGEQRAADGDWVELDGLELRPDGSQFGVQPRHASVRVAALRNQRRPEKRP
jgi:hypothetical protein